MNNIQQLIKELEDEVTQARKSLDFNRRYHKHYSASFDEGRIAACVAHIKKLTLLLNAETQTTVKSKPA